MSSEFYERAKRVVTDALLLAPGERAALLDRACAGDAALRAEVESLLEAASDTPDLLATSGVAGAFTPELLRDLESSSASAMPEAIGPYHLVGLIGEGGMGDVYRAEQTEPLRRDVAIKLIRRGLDTDRIVRRFEAERQTLARMDHPAIARVLDAGATDDGRPFFVMELVEGAPITTYCRERGLAVRDRLRLFLEVCAGVQHAHQKGIIHRDLKPSNILVRDQDGAPAPRIIDFGIAKAVSDDADDPLSRTQAGLLIGTPAYSSPEQAGAIDADVDTRSDVYSLGVVLFELLAGKRPYEFRTLTPSEVQRVLGGEVSVLPSTATGTRDSELAGDLDNIVLKAMARLPADRYGSVEQLADDVRRHLEGRPVHARAATWRYRAGKFVRRHVVSVTAAATVLVTLVTVTIVVAVQRDRAVEAEARASAEAATAETVSDFLVGLFRTSAPTESRGADITAREILDRGVAQVRDDLADQPAVQARLLNVMASVYYDLGLEDEALTLDRESVDIRRRIGAPPEDLAQSLNTLGEVLQNRQAFDDAEQAYREALDLYRQAYGESHERVATLLSNLGVLLQVRGRTDEAIQYTQQALDMRRAVLGPDHPDLGFSINNLAVFTHIGGDPAGSEPLYREALAFRERLLGPTHLDAVKSRNNLGNLLVDLGKLDEAEPLLRSALAEMRKQLPDGHETISRPLIGLGNLLLTHGQAAEAETAFREAFEIRRNAFTPGNWRTAQVESMLGEAVLAQGRREEARTLITGSLGRLEGALGPDSPYVTRAREALARLGEGR